MTIIILNTVKIIPTYAKILFMIAFFWIKCGFHFFYFMQYQAYYYYSDVCVCKINKGLTLLLLLKL